jgi:hypothetical protein
MRHASRECAGPRRLSACPETPHNGARWACHRCAGLGHSTALLCGVAGRRRRCTPVHVADPVLTPVVPSYGLELCAAPEHFRDGAIDPFTVCSHASMVPARLQSTSRFTTRVVDGHSHPPSSVYGRAQRAPLAGAPIATAALSRCELPHGAWQGRPAVRHASLGLQPSEAPVLTRSCCQGTVDRSNRALVRVLREGSRREPHWAGLAVVVTPTMT